MSDERMREPGEVLQGALLDLVNGARAVLDVVEELVTDPAGVAKVVESTFGAMRNAADSAGEARRTPEPESGHPAENQTEGDAQRSSRVTRIRVL